MNQNVGDWSRITRLIIAIISIILGYALVSVADTLGDVGLKRILTIIAYVLMITSLACASLGGTRWLRERGIYKYLLIVVSIAMSVMRVIRNEARHSAMFFLVYFSSFALWIFLLEKNREAQQTSNRTDITNSNSSESIGD